MCIKLKIFLTAFKIRLETDYVFITTFKLGVFSVNQYYGVTITSENLLGESFIYLFHLSI